MACRCRESISVSQATRPAISKCVRRTRSRYGDTALSWKEEERRADAERREAISRIEEKRREEEEEGETGAIPTSIQSRQRSQCMAETMLRWKRRAREEGFGPVRGQVDRYGI